MLVGLSRFLVAGCLVVASGIGSPAEAVAAPIGDLSMRGYYMETYTAERGLPQNTVDALVQTRDGYIWVATQYGLARFDGVSFRNFTLANTPGLSDARFTSLVEDTEGTLWAGTKDGLLKYERGMFVRFDHRDGLPDSRVDALYVRRKGGLWIGTRTGVGFLDKKEFTIISRLRGTDSVFEDSAGRLWFSNDNEVHLFDPSRDTTDIITDLNSPFYGRANCFYEDREKAIWFGTGYGLHRWRHGQIERFSPAGVDGQSNTPVNVECILEAPAHGGLWVGLGGGRGLHLFQDGNWLRAVPPSLPLLSYVQRCLEDAEGNLWLGSVSHGLARLRRPRLQSFGVEQGLTRECAWSVHPSRNGGVWVGTDEGFSHISDGGVQPYQPPSWKSLRRVIRSIYEDRDGLVWIGDHTGGVYRWDQKSFTHFGMGNGLMKALYQDRSGRIWAGHSEGMCRIHQGHVRQYTTNDGLAHRDVRAFLEDRQGRLWIGTYGGGISLFDGERFRHIGPANGLSSVRAYSFHEDSDGVVWIGTDNGLNRYQDDRIFVVTRKHGLFDDLVNHIVEDDHGMFWISCNRGIYRVSRSELNNVVAGRAAKVSHVAYGEADGMVSSETNGEYQPAGCKTADGRIWFPTQRGVVVIDPKNVYRNQRPPPVLIEQVKADDEVILGRDPAVISAKSAESLRATAQPIRLEPGRARVLEVRYTATSFADPAKVRFKHWLVGHEKDWRDAGNARVAYYLNLRPGRYRFRVAACNNHGFWNENGQEFEFILKPHFYETKLFYVFCGVGALMSAAGIQTYRLRGQRRLLQLEQQAALQRERARIAQDVHDDLGAHLTKIAILSELAKNQASDATRLRSTANTISDMARRAIDNVSEIVWVTNPKNDSLDNLIAYLRAYAAEFFDSIMIGCRMDFPSKVPSLPVKGEVRRDIFLVFKEALTNAARHSGASEVDIGLQVDMKDGCALQIQVRDNGRGFHLDDKSGGNGLKNMRIRAEKRGGTLDIQSAPGTGTRVQIRVSLQPLRRNGGGKNTTFMRLTDDHAVMRQ